MRARPPSFGVSLQAIERMREVGIVLAGVHRRRLHDRRPGRIDLGGVRLARLVQSDDPVLALLFDLRVRGDDVGVRVGEAWAVVLIARGRAGKLAHLAVDVRREPAGIERGRLRRMWVPAAREEQCEGYGAHVGSIFNVPIGAGACDGATATPVFAASTVWPTTMMSSLPSPVTSPTSRSSATSGGSCCSSCSDNPASGSVPIMRAYAISTSPPSFVFMSQTLSGELSSSSCPEAIRCGKLADGWRASSTQ